VYGVFVRDGVMFANFRGQEERIISVNDIKIPGGHNLENALAATALALAMNVPSYSIAHTLRTFSGVPHRLEFVAEIDGIQYINDSKGTNPDSTIKALEAYPAPIVLIAGGKNKGSNFRELALKIKEKVKYLVLVGKASQEIASAVEEIGYKNYILVDTFTETVQMATSRAKSGDIVLLSPACASWDMFVNYEQRGNLFKELVLHLGR
jgi:UDP-N-acetylmuramoylalanine--D-glutamate ligase